MPLGESRLVGELGSPLEKSDSDINVPLPVERQCEPAERELENIAREKRCRQRDRERGANPPPRSRTVSRPSAW